MTDTPASSEGFIVSLGNHVGAWRRIGRIFVSAFITLFATTAIGFPVFYLQAIDTNFLSGEQPSNLPFIILAIIGIALYVLTWSTFVGFDRQPTMQAGKRGGLLVLAGVGSLLIVIAELLWWIMNEMPT